MVEISISELSKRPKILDELQEIAKVVNKKEGEVKGIFIPKRDLPLFEELLEKIEEQRRIEKLKRVAQAQQEDMIGDGAVGDGL